VSDVISIQPGQLDEGMGYNVHKPLPYPFHIDAASGACKHGRGTSELGDAPEGKPWVLIGFQRGEEQSIVVTFAEFCEDPSAAIGLRPVFVGHGSFFALSVPVTDVTDHRSIDEVSA